LTTAGENDTGQLSVAATRHDALPLAPLGSSRSNKAFMITGIGVHDRVDWVFTITGMRTETPRRRQNARIREDGLAYDFEQIVR
jgi:hypothetical protein